MSPSPRLRSTPGVSAPKSKEACLRASDPKLEEISMEISVLKKKKKHTKQKKTQASPFIYFQDLILRGDVPL